MIRIRLRVRVVTAARGVDPPALIGSGGNGIAWARGNPVYTDSLSVIRDHVAAANRVWRQAGIEFFLPARLTNADLLYRNPALLETPGRAVTEYLPSFYRDDPRPLDGFRVYYLNTVQRRASGALAVFGGGGIALIPYGRGRDGLGHELGHLLGLGHTFDWFGDTSRNGVNAASLAPFPDDIARPTPGMLAQIPTRAADAAAVALPGDSKWHDWEVAWGLNPMNLMSYNKPAPLGGDAEAVVDAATGAALPRVRAAGFVEDQVLTRSQIARALASVFSRSPAWSRSGVRFPIASELVPYLRAAALQP